MELDDTYQNVNDFSPDQLRGDKRKREDLKSVTQMFSEMKASVANFKMEFSQIKINITGLTEETRSSFAELRTEISQLKENLYCFQCPDQWSRFEQNCYYFSSSETTWDEAQKSCTSMDANLLVINSAEEQVYLQGNLNDNHWIGLSDSVEEGNWSWVDGTDYASNVKFWESGQPNSNGDEGCVVAAANAAWHDWPCSSRHSSICKKPVQCYFP
ncbi:CD209 antigen-like protein C isoform X2 [Heptranchias perlo]|uniref:CD209 antigen-like protein C isoform X2 n=1 Tax=Heptranchias perlo TaxID=212740 RepID=UPI003559D998